MPRGERNVVIAGAGVAAALAACELRRRGFDVWLLDRPAARPAPAIESLPQRAISAFDDLDLGDALEQAGAVVGEGFENAWEVDEGERRLEGVWMYVERGALAHALQQAALSRGATIVRTRQLPALAPLRDESEGYQWAVEGLPRYSFSALDGTGRAARWIGATARYDVRVAHLFRGPGEKQLRAGRVIRTATGWAYALYHPCMSTVGLVEPRRAGKVPPQLTSEIANVLKLSEADRYIPIRRCAAHLQWSPQPAQGALIAIGDAALAYEPLAGQGIRFALASASAAVSVLHHRHAGHPLEIGQQYYTEFAASARRRHAKFLGEMVRGMPPPPEVRVELGQPWVFTGSVTKTAIRRENAIVSEPAIRLPDGEVVRWLASFDLLVLATLASSPRPLGQLQYDLECRGLAPNASRALLQWCASHRILSPHLP